LEPLQDLLLPALPTGLLVKIGLGPLSQIESKTFTQTLILRSK